MSKLGNIRRRPGGAFRFLVHGGDRLAGALGVAFVVGIAVLGLAIAFSQSDESVGIAWLVATIPAVVAAYLAILFGLFAPYAIDVDPAAARVTARSRRIDAVLWTAPLDSNRLHLAPSVRTFGRQRIPVTALVFGDLPAGDPGNPPPLPECTLLSTGPTSKMAALRDELLAGLPAAARHPTPAAPSVAPADIARTRQRAWFVENDRHETYLAVWAVRTREGTASTFLAVLRPTHALLSHQQDGFGLADEGHDVPLPLAERWLTERGYRVLCHMDTEGSAPLHLT